jgi:ribosomal protein S18 acetylase RimI-like enzyme
VAGSSVPRSTISNVEIRAAANADLEAIGAIYLDAARHHAGLEPSLYREPDLAAATARIGARIHDADREAFVALVDGSVVAMLELRFTDWAVAGSMLGPRRIAEVSLAVREADRGQGIGTALMAHAEERARARGCERLVLDAAAANTRAIRLYERLGYETYGVLMRKELR